VRTIYSVAQPLPLTAGPTDEQKMSNIRQKIFFVPILLVALVLLFLGGRITLAGIASYQAESFINDWENNGNEPESRAWIVAHAAAQRAISLYPVANGAYFDRLGLVQSWQKFRQPYADPAAAHSRYAALDAYRFAVALRPSWPYTWARLAHSKLYLQEFDEEFARAFSQAFQLGPWRIGVNREITEIGFSSWTHLSEKQRQATLESARRTVAYGQVEAQYLLKIAQQTGKFKLLCDSLSIELKRSRKLCL